MKLLQKTWKFLVNAGLVTFILTVMFIGAVSLFSLTKRGTVYYGNRCKTNLNQDAIDYLNQDEIIAYDYELNCNTLYLDLSVNDTLNKEKIISLLVRISSYYRGLNLTNDTQVTAKNSKYLILANLVDDGSVSLSVSEL